MKPALPRLREAREQGFTLIEMLITMILMGVVSTLVVVAVIQAQRVFTHTDDEETGLSDAKVVFDRVARDIRESRGVECDGGLADPTDPASSDPTCAAHLQLWIDSNSDYVRQPSEVVTWRLIADADGQHHDVYRIVGNGPGQLQASSLIVDAVFHYFTADGAAIPPGTSPNNAQQVSMVMRYEAIVDRGASPRTVEFSARLRNKG